MATETGFTEVYVVLDQATFSNAHAECNSFSPILNIIPCLAFHKLLFEISFSKIR